MTILLCADPALSAGKPIALVLLQLENNQAKVLDCYTHPDRSPVLMDDEPLSQIEEWSVAAASYVQWADGQNYTVDGIACEVPPGGRGWGFGLKLVAKQLEIEARRLGLPFLAVHPRTVKLAATGSGKATAEQVAEWVNRIVEGAANLPVTPDYDFHAACAVGLAAYLTLKLARLTENHTEEIT